MQEDPHECTQMAQGETVELRWAQFFHILSLVHLVPGSSLFLLSRGEKKSLSSTTQQVVSLSVIHTIFRETAGIILQNCRAEYPDELSLPLCKIFFMTLYSSLLFGMMIFDPESQLLLGTSFKTHLQKKPNPTQRSFGWVDWTASLSADNWQNWHLSPAECLLFSYLAP